MEPSVSFREKKLSDEVLFQMIRGFNGIRLTDEKGDSFVCAAETGLLPIIECLSGISKNISLNRSNLSQNNYACRQLKECQIG